MQATPAYGEGMHEGFRRRLVTGLAAENTQRPPCPGELREAGPQILGYRSAVFAVRCDP